MPHKRRRKTVNFRTLQTDEMLRGWKMIYSQLIFMEFIEIYNQKTNKEKKY